MKLLWLIGFVGLTYFALYLFKDARYDYVTKIENNIISAKIIRVPEFQMASNKSIDVEYLGKRFSIRISPNAYINHKYKINDEVLLCYSESIDHAILAEAKPEFSYYFSIAFFAFPFYCLFKLLITKKN